LTSSRNNRWDATLTKVEPKTLEISAPVLIVMKNLLPLVAPGDDVQQRLRVFKYWFPDHGPFLAPPRSIVDNQA
jgi:hypothetical protein